MQSLRSVLYVDDDPDICAVVQATLSAIADVRVRTAPSGEIAIDFAREERPDLILMDVMMPNLDGPATLKRIHDCTPIADIPVIFLTAKVMPTEVTQLLNLGAIGVIGKPFDPMKLCGDIRTLWEKTSIVPVIEPAQSTQRPARVTSLTGSFLDRAEGDVERLRQACFARPGDRSLLKELERLAHSIHGAAAMFGFPAISTCGGAVEDLLEEMMKSMPAGAEFEPALLNRLSERTERLAREVQAARLAGAAGTSTPPHLPKYELAS